MDGDKALVSLLIGRLGAAVMVVVSGLLLFFGIQVAPDDATGVIDAGTEMINAGALLAAKITAGIALLQTLISKYKPRK